MHGDKLNLWKVDNKLRQHKADITEVNLTVSSCPHTLKRLGCVTVIISDPTHIPGVQQFVFLCQTDTGPYSCLPHAQTIRTNVSIVGDVPQRAEGRSTSSWYQRGGMDSLAGGRCGFWIHILAEEEFIYLEQPINSLDWVRVHILTTYQDCYSNLLDNQGLTHSSFRSDLC